MKNIKQILFLYLIIIGSSMGSWGQVLVLKQTNASGIYKNGRHAQVVLFVNDKSIDSVTVSERTNYSKEATTRRMKIEADSVIIFNKQLTSLTSIIFEVSTEKEFASIGLIVDPDKFRATTERPKDIKRFWKNEKQMLRKLPLRVDSILLKDQILAYNCYDVQISCLGPKPARGYFAKPTHAKAKSLPIVLNLHAAGVSGSWCKSDPEIALRYSKMGSGALCFDLNAHGMLNGQNDEYYLDLEKTELKNYSRSGLDNKSDIYFRGMYLRLIRTLDFLTSQPEWDGKRILLIGESQGGGQALVAAGLDSRVSAVVATVPAMCAWDTCLTRRQGGWPYPFEATDYDKKKMLSTLPYFDAAHILKNSKATIIAEIGLIDLTCPASSIFSAINQVKGRKTVFVVPYRAHNLKQTAYNTEWENTVGKPKELFISDYLK